MIEQLIEDPELGPVFVRKDVRVRRFNFRFKLDGIHVSLPVWVDAAVFRQALETLRPRLLQTLRETSVPSINLYFTINRPFFKLRLLEGKVTHFTINEKTEVVTSI